VTDDELLAEVSRDISAGCGTPLPIERRIELVVALVRRECRRAAEAMKQRCLAECRRTIRVGTEWISDQMSQAITRPRLAEEIEAAIRSLTLE